MQTFSLLAPLIFICLFGFMAIKIGLLNKTHSDALSKICFNVLLPLFLFRSTYLTDLDANISLSWFLSFYLPVVASFVLVFVINRHLINKNAGNATMRALVANYSNTVLIAIPILASLLPQQVAGQAFVLIGLHSAILFTLTEILLHGRGLKTILAGLNNPIVLSISLGLICNLIQLPIPKLVLQPMQLLSQSAIALALFGLGASMNFLPIRGNRTTALLLSLHKLLLLPFAVFVLGAYGLDLNAQQLLISVLLTASPTGAAAFLVATQHEECQDVAATTVVLSTLLCPFTYLVWIQLLT